MGGIGSGRPPPLVPRVTTCDCPAVLSVSDLGKAGLLSRDDAVTATLAWSDQEGKGCAEVEVTVRPGGDEPPTIGLAFGLRDDENIRLVTQKVRSTRTLLHSGGRRLWFLCPACNRRVGKIYLPPDAVLFACRLCHALAYRSRQCRYLRGG